MCCKIQKRYIVLICVVFLLFLIGSFYDLEISKLLYIGQYPNDNIFGIIFSYIGILPAFAGWSFLGAIILYLSKEESNKKRKTFLKGLSIFQYVLSFFFLCNTIMFTNLNVINVHWALAYGLGIIIFLLSMYGGYIFAKKSDNKYLLNKVVFISMISILTMFLAMGIKEIMLRPRYKLVLELNDYNYFINWWENGRVLKDSIGESINSDFFKSFPSGHSAYAMFAIFIFPMLVDNKSKKYESFLFICGVIWWILTAYSRLTIGAHYLTDVCFGGLITLISYVIITLILKKKIKSN